LRWRHRHGGVNTRSDWALLVQSGYVKSPIEEERAT
jgi:hypothetical protein